MENLSLLSSITDFSPTMSSWSYLGRFFIINERHNRNCSQLFSTISNLKSSGLWDTSYCKTKLPICVHLRDTHHNSKLIGMQSYNFKNSRNTVDVGIQRRM